ncbi:MAG: metallophosphoesterase [Lachnospiraceae bacterium]|nr:metallophosphoesterase [Lachnospiraceae bacterium]
MQYVILIIVAVVIVVVGLLYREMRIFRVSEYAFPTPKLKGEGFKIAVLADLHGKIYGEDNNKLYDAIDRAAPDIIICAGDMLTARWEYTFEGHFEDDGTFISGNEPYEKMIRLLSRLAKKYPVFYGNGNHESRLYRRREKFGDAYEHLGEALRDAGINYLVDSREDIEVKGTPVSIYGLDIEKPYYERFEKITMEKDYITGKLGPAADSGDSLKLLIAHNPDYFDAYMDWGADLAFSGHLHGGVMRLPFVGGVISPQFHLFPKYSGGMYYNKDGRALMVSRGIGTHSVNIRIFNRAEVVMIKVGSL